MEGLNLHRDVIRQSGGANRGNHRCFQMGKRVQQRRNEHVSRDTTDGIEMDMNHERLAFESGGDVRML